MRFAMFIVAVGFVVGSLPISAFDGTAPQSSVLYNGDALRAAIADGMSRAGGAIASVDAADGRH